MKIISVLAILFAFGQTTSQVQYVPFPSQSLKVGLNSVVYNGMGYVETQHQGIDMNAGNTFEHGGQSYWAIDEPLVIGLREDTISQQLFCLSNDSVEYDITLDIDLQEGDTAFVSPYLFFAFGMIDGFMGGGDTSLIPYVIENVITTENVFYFQVVGGQNVLEILPHTCSYEPGIGLKSVTGFEWSRGVVCTRVNDEVTFGYMYDMSWGGNTGNYYCTALNIPEIESLSVTTYPNPCSSYLNVDVSIPTNDGNINLYNIQGQKVAFEQIRNTGNSIDVSQLPGGSYFLEVNIQGERYAEIITISK